VSEVPLPIHVDTRYERFPASIRGAFVMRGADGNPHAVRIEEARIGRLPAGPGRPFPVETRIVDVAPSRDLFVPFEAPIAEVEPGWYALESTMKVDGARSFEFASRPFTVPWPRSDVRRGTVALDQTVRIGKRDVRIERVEMGSDAASVVWSTATGGAGGVAGVAGPAGGSAGDAPPGEAMLIADGEPLALLPPQVERSGRLESLASGEVRTVSYPVPRATRSLAVVVRVGSGRSGPIPIPLH
jgi:hypothetical protein